MASSSYTCSQSSAAVRAPGRAYEELVTQQCPVCYQEEVSCGQFCSNVHCTGRLCLDCLFSWNTACPFCREPWPQPDVGAVLPALQGEEEKQKPQKKPSQRGLSWRVGKTLGHALWYTGATAAQVACGAGAATLQLACGTVSGLWFQSDPDKKPAPSPPDGQPGPAPAAPRTSRGSKRPFRKSEAWPNPGQKPPPTPPLKPPRKRHKRLPPPSAQARQPAKKAQQAQQQAQKAQQARQQAQKARKATQKTASGEQQGDGRCHHVKQGHGVMCSNRTAPGEVFCGVHGGQPQHQWRQHPHLRWVPVYAPASGAGCP